MKKWNRREIGLGGLVTGIALVITLLVVEGLVRFKNMNMQSYDIEMWRYAKELKRPVAQSVIGHEHVPNKNVTLQSVMMRTNEWGMRGGAIEPKRTSRRILFLGSSITLGWGVAEEQTLTKRLETSLRTLGQQVEVLNAGIGNYNSQRYVELYLTKLKALEPSDIVVHYFLRDAESLEGGRNHWLLKHSELAVTLWNVGHHLFNSSSQKVLEDHYRAVYRPEAEGFLTMKKALGQLANHARENHTRLYLAMTPDIHNLTNYPFTYIHDTMKGVSEELGYQYVDLLAGLQGLDPSQVWAMPGDPHPNALGHEKMADVLLTIFAPKS